MTIPKEYNHNTDPPTLMVPWGHQVEAEIKTRFGIAKPLATSDVKDYMLYLAKSAELVQEHGSPITFERLCDYTDARSRTEDGYRVVVNRWWLIDGQVGGGELIVGWGATLPFCNAIKRLIDDGTLQVTKPHRMLRFVPSDHITPPGLSVTVFRGECPDGEPRD